MARDWGTGMGPGEGGTGGGLDKASAPGLYIGQILKTSETREMFALRHLLEALAAILDMALTIYMWVIIARALLSWVNPDPYNPIVRFLYNVTEPVLSWIRRRVPVVFGGLDLGPVLVLLAIVFLQRFLVRTLLDLAQQFG
jgi:YggT family protein